VPPRLYTVTPNAISHALRDACATQAKKLCVGAAQREATRMRLPRALRKIALGVTKA
jgi:hypothetical protein